MGEEERKGVGVREKGRILGLWGKGKLDGGERERERRLGFW